MSKRGKGTPAVMRHRRVHKRMKGSSTPGRQKGYNCQASNVERSMARRSRSYKDQDYSTWCAAVDANVRGTSVAVKK